MSDYDFTGNIIAYETGELDGEDVLTLFSHLVKTGQAWILQGSYGRYAAALIENGALDKAGNILIDTNSDEGNEDEE